MNFMLGKRWQESYPQAVMGVLIIHGLSSTSPAVDLGAERTKLEIDLRRRFTGFDRTALKALPAIQAYDEYYNQFKKTYHLLLQLESVLGGKSIPSGDALVSAMFMAELEDLLLTAGHDLDQISGSVRFDAAQGSENYERMNREIQTLKSGDLYSADDAGVLSSVIYGPDRRTRIQPATTAALFTTYGVPGIGSELVYAHLRRLHDLICKFSPGAEVIQLEVYGA